MAERAFVVAVSGAPNAEAPHAAADFLEWQRRYLTNYQKLRPMYVTQRDAIRPTADLVLDGAQSADVSAETVKKALAALGVAS
jgi:hypothetical protein